METITTIIRDIVYVITKDVVHDDDDDDGDSKDNDNDEEDGKRP